MKKLFSVVTCLAGVSILGASTANLQSVNLPSELGSVSVSSLQIDRAQFILTGSKDGGCVIAVFSQEMQVLALRTLPGSHNSDLLTSDSCRLASIDSAGDIVVLGSSGGREYPSMFTFDSGGTERILMKMSRSSLEIIYSIRIRLGESILALAVAPDDSIWLGGYVSAGLLTTPDAVQRSYPGPAIISPRDRAGFVARLSSDGQRLLYSSYLGGTRDAVGTLSVDCDGSIYAAGSRIWKFSSSGHLIWSTWLFPSSTLGSAIGRTCDLYVVGTTGVGKFYATPGAFQSFPLNQFGDFVGNLNFYPAESVDGFVARFSPSGQLIYSTLMGGLRADSLSNIIVEADGAAFVAGNSHGNLFPTRAALAMGTDSVVAKLSPDRTSVSFSTYTIPSLSNPVRLADGSYLMTSILTVGSTIQTSAYRLTELADSLPRIDLVADSAQPGRAVTSGSNATIFGEGFSSVTTVSVGDIAAQVVSRGEQAIEIEIPVGLPGLTAQGGIVEIKLLRDTELLWSVSIPVLPPAR